MHEPTFHAGARRLIEDAYREQAELEQLKRETLADCAAGVVLGALAGAILAAVTQFGPLVALIRSWAGVQ
ncbi:MAG: hypothetical protein ACK40O_00945 [Allosphingosinicella sp.]